MKSEHTPFFGSLFSPRSLSAETEQPRQVVVTSYSQPHVLQQRMREERLTHGETVTANISPVRLETERGKMVMYFCPMKSIEVLHTIANGDGGNLPAQVIVEGLTAPEDLKPGMYKLRNVTLSSNGTMQVKATANTTWEMA